MLFRATFIFDSLDILASHQASVWPARLWRDIEDRRLDIARCPESAAIEKSPLERSRSLCIDRGPSGSSPKDVEASGRGEYARACDIHPAFYDFFMVGQDCSSLPGNMRLQRNRRLPP